VVNKLNIRDKGITELPKAMPDHYKVKCPVQSYRNYYIGDKIKFASWKNRQIPFWFSN
jgi:hypothetical protein